MDIRVLIVDDEKDMHETCVEYLRNHGYNAFGVKNSKEAFKAIEKFRPNILILDINLRERNTGVDVLERALRINPEIQAAVLTGIDEEDNLTRMAKTAGAKLIHKKPITIGEITELINNLAKNLTTKKGEVKNGRNQTTVS